MKIKNVIEISELDTIQIGFLECVLMDNNEVIFKGKSLGILKEEEIKKYFYIKEQE